MFMLMLAPKAGMRGARKTYILLYQVRARSSKRRAVRKTLAVFAEINKKGGPW